MHSQQTEMDDRNIYKVVINHEEQYSIWPADRESPLGWVDAGKTGPKAECLSYIKEVWTDMRPLSLRKKMEEMAQAPPQPAPPMPDRKSLVDRLSEGLHPLEASLRPEKTVTGLKQAIDRNYVHLRFTGTEGGTELGVRLDAGACNFSQADFDHGAGMVHLEGSLTLDYVPCRCVADIDLQTLEGTGHLVKEAQATA